MELSMEEIEVATKGFSIDFLIGKGSHGCVYKGTLKGGKVVAVKKPSVALQLLQDNTKLDNEIDILSSLRSPHIVNLLGVCENSSGQKVLITEFMPNGSLEDYLHNSPRPPSWRRRATIALQLAEAILALHHLTPPVVHRDIKSSNILLDSDSNANLADFGLAVRCHHPCSCDASILIDSSTDSLSCSSSSSSGSSMNSNGDSSVISPTIPAGTIGYLDPLYTNPENLSTKNDVFSFGVVLLEIVSGRRAIDIACEPASIVEWAVQLIHDDRIKEVCDSRLKLYQFAKDSMRQMMRIAAQCVSHKIEQRPSMEEVVSELRSVVKSCHYSFQSLVRGRFLSGGAAFFKLKRKQTVRTILCKVDEAAPEARLDD